MGTPETPVKRNIGKTFIVYLGSTWVFIEAFNFIIDKYHFQAFYLDIIIILVLFGLPSTLIHERFHRFAGKALLFHILNVTVAFSVITYNLINPDQLKPTELRLLRFQENQKIPFSI